MEELLRASKELAAVMRLAGQTYDEAADRILSYDNQAYPIPYVFMSVTVAAFLRALAAAEGVDASSTEPAYPRPSYGPSLRESA